MVEQEREGRNVVARCLNMDMFWVVSAVRENDDGLMSACKVHSRSRDCRIGRSTHSRMNLQDYSIT